MSNWFPFPAYADFAPLDISYLFEDEKPAGKHGFLKTDGDRFVFEDGTPVKFWGTNLNSGAAFPEHEYAEKLAHRLASYGCNMVRFHQIDAEWATPNLYQYHKGRRLADTRTFDPRSLDLLDYFMDCLKKEGIYVYLDMMTYRKFKEADGVRNAGALIDRAAPYSLFDGRLMELQKEYMAALWNHVNPYSGIAYKDDPQIVLTDVVNEVCLFGCFKQSIEVEPYATEFRERFRVWCREQGETLDVDSVDLNDRAVEPLVRFKIELGEKYYGEMMDYMRSLGVKIPITGPNFSWKFVQCKAAQHIGDFMDSHLNVRYMKWEPELRISRDLGMHSQMEWGAMRNLRMRHFGRPFFTSEWDLTYPNRYRAESSIMMAAIGCLQNWSGYTIHTYAYSSLLRYADRLGKEVSSGAIGGVGYREGIFSTWNDPAKFGLFYHAALMTRRGDVQPAKNKYTVRIEELEADSNQAPGKVTDSSKLALKGSAELSQIAADYYGECADAIPETEPLVRAEAGEVRSDTGELYRSWEKQYGTVDTPMTKSVYGRLDRQGTVKLNGLEVTCENDYAVIALSSLHNELPLEATDAMLLTTVGDVRNTDQKMSVAPAEVQKNPNLPPFLQMDDFGHAPILCEAIEATIRLKTDRTNLAVWAVNAEGFYAGKLPVTYEDGWATFTVGKKFPSVYYFIQAE